MARIVTKLISKCDDCPYKESHYDWAKEVHAIYCSAVAPPKFTGQYWNTKDMAIPDWCPFPKESRDD